MIFCKRKKKVYIYIENQCSKNCRNSRLTVWIKSGERKKKERILFRVYIHMYEKKTNAKQLIDFCSFGWKKSSKRKEFRWKK